ncbi:MAG TPA: hypothetical protein VFF03_11375 [Rhodocyclaceae bacterium]|nr:hypothetical protein [Rhodocyclaceae bacterium]
MKKVILAAVIGIASTGVMAATALCDGTGTPKTVAAGTAGTDFNVAEIKLNCSNNVFLQYGRSSNAMSVGSASSKGKTIWSGHTNGGSVTRASDCSGNACTATSAASGAGTAADTALTAASSG